MCHIQLKEGQDLTASNRSSQYQFTIRRSKVWQALLCIALAYLAMLLAYQLPYSYTLDISKASAAQATGFILVDGLGQPGYLWGQQYASFNLPNPGSPARITVNLGGRSDGKDIPFTLNQQPLGSVTPPKDGTMTSHSFDVPFALLGQDSLHVGIVAPVLKARNQRLSVQVASATIASGIGIGVAWPPALALLLVTVAALLLVLLSWLVETRWRRLVVGGGAFAIFLLLLERVNVTLPLLLFCVALLLAVSVILYGNTALAWLRCNLDPAALHPRNLPHLLLTSGPETMPLFRAALALIILLQIPIYSHSPAAPETPINAYYFIGLLLLLVAFTLRGPTVTWALVGAMIVAGVALRLYWANVPTASDVFWANQQANYFILNGQNPYAEQFTWVPGTTDYIWYGYFPFTIFTQMPFYLIFNNVRLGLVVCDLLTIGLIYLLVRDRFGREIGLCVTTLLLLYIPLSDNTILPSIVDPVMMFWLALSFYLLTKERWTWAALTAGLALASKQYAVFYVLVLLAFFIKQRRWRESAVVLIVPTVIILPFFLWSPADFINDTVLLHLGMAPAPVPEQWNTSLWAQGIALFSSPADYFTAPVLKPIAGAVLGLTLLLFSIFNLLKPSLVQIAATTTVLMVITFTLNSGYTQFFYWRDVVFMVMLWAAVWQPSGVIAPISPPAGYALPALPKLEAPAAKERAPELAASQLERELRPGANNTNSPRRQ